MRRIFVGSDKTTLMLGDKRWIDAQGISGAGVWSAAILLVGLFALVAILPAIPWQDLPARMAGKIIGRLGAGISQASGCPVLGADPAGLVWNQGRQAGRLLLSPEGIRYIRRCIHF
jgi:hypothetical protein